MKLNPIKLVTIIALDSLEKRLIADIKEMGAKGYTISEATGEGLSVHRLSQWEGKNIRIETLVNDAVADKIMEKLSKDYFSEYRMVAFVSTVEVLRREKF